MAARKEGIDKKNKMATPEATSNYFKKLQDKNFNSSAIRQFGNTGWSVSQVGFGGYRVHNSSEQHAAALNHAFLNGINLIDTSSNYTDGGSELLIGKTLQELSAIKQISRDEVVVVSKVGYVQGQNLNLVQDRESGGNPFPDMVKYMDGCWHCIHPDFLQDQLRLSLSRLQLDHLDAYLLHNPEYFLSDARKKAELDLRAAREEYYRRIKLAFEWMEQKVAEGKIQYYGISSNTFPNSSQDFEFTSLEKVYDIANEISSGHHFQVIQFPFNLYATGACLTLNQVSDKLSLLDFASENQLATLVNRPLNAMAKDSMVRLASFRETDPNIIREQFEVHLQELQEVEPVFNTEVIEKLLGEISKESLEKVFLISGQLKFSLESFQSWSQWDHVKENILIPQIASYINYINKKLKADTAWQNWSKKYMQIVRKLCEVITLHYENQVALHSNEISGKLSTLCPDLTNSSTLSQKTLRILSSTGGVDCVLLGMRKMKYVADALDTFSSEKIENANQILGDLQLG